MKVHLGTGGTTVTQASSGAKSTFFSVGMTTISLPPPSPALEWREFGVEIGVPVYIVRAGLEDGRRNRNISQAASL